MPSVLRSQEGWDNLVQIQVVAPRSQAKGFDRFCREVSIQKSEFFVREIDKVLRQAEKRNRLAEEGRVRE